MSPSVGNHQQSSATKFDFNLSGSKPSNFNTNKQDLTLSNSATGVFDMNNTLRHMYIKEESPQKSKSSMIGPKTQLN